MIASTGKDTDSRAERTLDLLYKVAKASLQFDDLFSMSQILVDGLGELLNANSCFLSQWDEAHQKVIPLAVYGLSNDTDKHTLPPFEAGAIKLTESALKEGQPLAIENVSASPHIDLVNGNKFPARSVMVFPILAGKTQLGGIIVAFNERHKFQKEEILIGEQVSNVIALALQKYLAVEQAYRRTEESETLRRAAAVVNETLQADEAVARILEQLARVIPYDSASVQLISGNELEIVGGHGWENPKDVVGMRFPIPGDNPNTVVIETQRPYILPEADKVYAAFRNPPHSHIRSWLGAPLIVRGKTIGLLAIDSSERNHFTKDNIFLAQAFAEQVAIALENARLFTETQNLAITDPLTGLFNRRGLFQLGDFEFARIRRNQRTFSAVMIDIDHFKKVNDKHGHPVGDQALRALAERCRGGLRSVDLIGRYGGEEFVVLLPETNLDTAATIAERLRHRIMADPIETDIGALRITVSAGVAEALETDSLQSLIERSDLALYDAKREGRNRVALAKN